MEKYSNDYERYQKAQKKVKEIKGFYGNLISYIVVISVLAFINLSYSPNHLWFFYPMLGWGLGVFLQAMSVFNFFPFLNKNWEEKKIKQFMEEEKNEVNKYK
ncbi:2TM domain-containing protein [Flavobacterium jejuense]|uniref:2TM domain-containing protein n=1 Tax=Flavobacterium jejuense TaxID=1544455 RepID=A0ABX0IMC8_9FLAO|nr:2TM domain-containing protein [Flavobacterium jejuense]NHN24391.1 2TM domain-containing protein [Flavobacterium jejuense]